MNVEKNFLIECSRINSPQTKTDNNFDNKSSFITSIPNISLKKFDRINLSNCIINIPGADSNSINFTGKDTDLNNNIQDNFCIMKIGFYINHNAHYTANLPLRYESTSGEFLNLQVDNENTTFVNNNRVINNSCNSHNSLNYFAPSDDLVTDDCIKNIPSIYSLNPFSQINSKKYSRISPNYQGWMRPNTNGHLGLNIMPELLYKEIPFLIKEGFTNPLSIAEQITLTLNKSDLQPNLYQPKANKYKHFVSSQPNKFNLNQYNFNGYTYVTTNCNFQIENNNQHHVYGNLFVDDPMLWKYGCNFLSNLLVDNCQGNAYINPNDASRANYTIDYPVIIWQIFSGNDPTDFDPREIGGQYNYYSPHSTSLIDDQSGDKIITTKNFTQSYSDFNDIFRLAFTGSSNGGMIYATSNNSFKLIRSFSIGTNLHDYGVFVDNDKANITDIIAWNRNNILSGTWNGCEHQIFIPTTQNNLYVYDPPNSENYFYYPPDSPRQFITVLINNPDPVSGIGNYFISNLFNLESGGVLTGGEYILKFTLTIVDGYSWSNTNFIVESGIPNSGLNTQTFNSNGDYTINWTSNITSSSADILKLGFYFNGTKSPINITSISLLQEHINQDENYNLSTLYTSDLVNPQNNKLYSYQKIPSKSDIKLTITNNSLPSQGAYVGVDYYREYTLLTKGVIFSSVGNVFSAITTLNNHDPNVALFYNNDDPDYTYWIYQTYSSSTTWYAVRCSKYNGGVPQNGTQIGTIESNIAILKNTNRNGQQMYDYAAGNGWTGTVKNILKNITNPFDASTSTMTFDPTGCDVHYTYHSVNSFDFEYIANETQTWKYVQTILKEPVVANETFTISFTISNLTNPGQPIPQPFRIITSYIEGGVNYNPRDFTAEGNHSFSFVTTQAPLNPALPIYFGFFNTHSVSGQQDRISNFKIERSDDVNITSLVSQNLPTVTSGGTTYEYFASFSAHDHIGNFFPYFLGLVPDPTTDEEKLGTAGILLWSEDGGNTYFTGSWLYNTATKILGCFSDSSFTLTAASGTTPTLTNIVEYPTSFDQTIFNETYSVPTNGKQYGNSWDLYGTTQINNISSPIYYLGYLNSTDPNDILNVKEGYVFDNINDTIVNNNNNLWRLEDDEDPTKSRIQILDATSEVVKFSFNADNTNVKQNGWSIFRCNKISASDIDSSDSIDITNVTNFGFITLNEQSIDNFKSVQTNDKTGINYNIQQNYKGSTVDNGLFQNFENVHEDRSKAYLEKHQLLMTNIVLNMDNLKIIEDFFRYNEIYNGSYENRSDIINDLESYYVKMDLGMGDDYSVDIDNRDSTNTTGLTPVFQAYCIDNNDKMNVNDNVGAICPRYKTSSGNENRVNIFTRWNDNYETTIKDENMFGYQYNYGSKISIDKFKTDYPDLYNYCKNNNIGIIPYYANSDKPTINNPTPKLRLGFELYQDYINDELWKIQNFSFFGFSPSFVDHNYVTSFNNDSPSIDDPPVDVSGNFQYGTTNTDLCNYINLGAHKPELDFDQGLGIFNWKYWHTPIYFNLQTGEEANIGQEICSIFDSSDRMVIQDWILQDNVDNYKRNIGINDSQSGIFLIDVFYKKTSKNLITNSNDPLAVKMTKDNFNNTFWFKLGYTYNDLFPIRFKYNAFHENRFTELTYNNVSSLYRENGLGLLTTNALVNINNMPEMNLFTKNSGTDEESKFLATPIFGLGYNNNLNAKFQVESSSMYAKSIPVNLTTGFYRIYCDIPNTTMDWYANNTNMQCIGIALLNYSSSQQFFFSYAMDYSITVSKPINISTIKIEFRNQLGQIVYGLGDFSTVILKVTRNIELEQEPTDPVVEKLEDIEKDIEDNNKELKASNLNTEIDELKEENREKEPTNEMIDFAKNFQIQLIQNVLSKVLIKNSDNAKDISRRISTGLASYFGRKDNIKTFKKIENRILNNDIKSIENDPDVLKMISSLKNFYINSEGKAVKGSKSRPNNIEINEDAAEILMDFINEQYSINSNISVSELSRKLLEKVGFMIQNTNDIKLITDNQRLTMTENEKKKDIERGYNKEHSQYLSKILNMPLDTFLKIVLKLNEKDIRILKKTDDYNDIKKIYKEADKDFLQTNFASFRKRITQINNEINDSLGYKEKASTELEKIKGLNQLSETSTTPRKTRRRTKKEVTEARQMGSEDKPKKRGSPTKEQLQKKEESKIERQKGKKMIEEKETGGGLKEN